jgi:hypothetical protein
LLYAFFVLFYVFFCVVLCDVCFVTFPVLFVCIYVLNNCHWVTTQLQLNIYIISYQVFFVINLCHQGKTLCSPCIIFLTETYCVLPAIGNESTYIYRPKIE